MQIFLQSKLISFCETNTSTKDQYDCPQCEQMLTSTYTLPVDHYSQCIQRWSCPERTSSGKRKMLCVLNWHRCCVLSVRRWGFRQWPWVQGCSHKPEPLCTLWHKDLVEIEQGILFTGPFGTEQSQYCSFGKQDSWTLIFYRWKETSCSKRRCCLPTCTAVISIRIF